MSRPAAARRPIWRWLPVAACCGLALGACGTTRLYPEPRVPVDLAGHWIVDPAMRADAEKLIGDSLPKPRPIRRERPQADDGGGRDPRPDSGDGGGRGGRGGGDQRRGQQQGGQSVAQAPSERPTAYGRLSPAAFMRAFALPPQRLDVEQAPALVALGTAERRRSFVPGDEDPRSVTDRYGSRRVQAGWQNDEFLITAVDGSRLSVREHYRRLPKDLLELTIDFEAAGLKALRVRAVYRRATDAEIEAAVQDEGPPAPVAR